MYKCLSILLLIIIITGCTSEPNGVISGKWMMHRIMQNGNDVTEEHDPYNERFLILHDDSTFLSGGRPYGENTGKYSFNDVDKTFVLFSDAGPEDDSQWRITIQNDTMKWQGFGSEWADGFQIIYTKNE